MHRIEDSLHMLEALAPRTDYLKPAGMIAVDEKEYVAPAVTHARAGPHGSHG